jgi:glutathione peroxidase
MNVVRSLRRIFSGLGSGARVPRGAASRRDFLGLLFLLVGIAGTAALWSRVEDSIVDVAFGPVAILPDAAQDDGAGDALTPSAEADLYLPGLGVLEDDRVVAAMGPIARLSCRKDDPANADAVTPAAAAPATANAAPTPPTGVAAPSAPAEVEVAQDPLDRPLAATGADTKVLASEPLLSAAAAPIAMVAVTPETSAGECPALLQRTFNRLQTGKPESLCQFGGKVLLVVNTASYCGYTHQYEGLEAMYRKYKDRGLVVVGFPSNDFGKQEPGSNQEIAEFCRLTYGVQFPMFEKSSVSDLKSNPLFADLAARTGKSPQWNFHKYVIDRTGAPVASFTSQVEPTDRSLVSLIERLLAEQPRKS